MDPTRFDTVAKLFAKRRLSRRQALAQGGAGLAAGALAAAGLAATALAQDATPEVAGESAASMLFVQSFQAGTIAPKDGAPDCFTLTLAQGHGQTIYFSDRPDRIVGASPTPQFLEGLGFPDDNPPNAALVVETAPGETDIAVVELFNPLYDPETQGVTYDIAVLANWQAELEMGFHEAPTDLAALAPSFGAAHLFIDDCANRGIPCFNGNRRVGEFQSQDFCFWWRYLSCNPCEPDWAEDRADLNAYWKRKCNDTFPACNGACDTAL
jgi:hypothetical protein